MSRSDNPKAARAERENKVPMHLIPWRALEQVARAMESGAAKYGERNWRIDPIKCSTYEGSIARHTFLEWAQGVDQDKDSGLHPLAHVAATCLVILDAIEHGTLIDDRGRAMSKGLNMTGHSDPITSSS